jgi:aminoglycoside 6'-N-acetyltransferase I
VRIVDLDFSDAAVAGQAAALLVDGFREHWPEAWPTLDDALVEVREANDSERVARVALDADSRTVLGWIGGISRYHGRVWELHPSRGRSRVGCHLEARIAERGGLTLMLGTGDEDDQTTLSGVNLYDELPRRIGTVRNLKMHPFEFYQRVGFTIIGVVPDANGRGKPDILMAKRIP